MSDSKKPKIWLIRRQSIKHKWAVLFVYFEWMCEQLSELLKQWAFLDILGHAGRFTVLVAVVFYIWGCPERQRQAENQRKAKHYQAWQVINLAQGKSGSGGRRDALEDLTRDGVSLSNIDISKADIPKINLENSKLWGANLAGAILVDANFSKAKLMKANFTEANLWRANLAGAELAHAILTRACLWDAKLTGANLFCANLAGADLKNIKNWQNIRGIEYANIYDVQNPPDEFIKWALEHGAVSIEDNEEWEKLLKEKQQKQ